MVDLLLNFHIPSYSISVNAFPACFSLYLPLQAFFKCIVIFEYLLILGIEDEKTHWKF